MHCGEKRAVGTPRCKLDVEIVDETGHIAASVFGLLAESLLLHSSKQVMELEQEGKKLPLLNINKRLQDQEFVVQLRSQAYTQQGRSTSSYSIISLHDASHYDITTNTIEHGALPNQKKRMCTEGEDQENDNASLKRIKKA
ncbi:PREDICTED: uncharacterized protein LOC109192451 [Ipomoea nil]|uniref:uncharacterized protein LOC109177152 n=1 Tax=Ipomoea nil TaxID=35883 RepID=UPI0009010311|nr:PREDICTED: uncharacterized protein LOC109177152 [Ipomoea nil]XP_019198647.1 PREDICTED: uncharacterized protein LOC109192451 [Ipomoea nil]